MLLYDNSHTEDVNWVLQAGSKFTVQTWQLIRSQPETFAVNLLTRGQLNGKNTWLNNLQHLTLLFKGNPMEYEEIWEKGQGIC